MADNFNILDQPGLVSPANQAALAYLKPTGSLVENFSRMQVIADTALLASGTLRLVPIALPSGLLVSSISFRTGSGTALATPTHQWFTLHDSNRVMLGVTGDDTTTGWGTNVTKTLSLGTPFRTTYAGLHYVGAMVAAGTMPSMFSTSAAVNLNIVPPIMGGSTSDTGLTTPPVAPFTAGAISAGGGILWCYVS